MFPHKTQEKEISVTFDEKCKDAFFKTLALFVWLAALSFALFLGKVDDVCQARHLFNGKY